MTHINIFACLIHANIYTCKYTHANIYTCKYIHANIYMQIYTCKYIDMSHLFILFVHTIISIIFACMYTGPHTHVPVSPTLSDVRVSPTPYVPVSPTLSLLPLSLIQYLHLPTCIQAAMRTSSDVQNKKQTSKRSKNKNR
jgi:hypothetical protein